MSVSGISLSAQLITISVISLQRQILHNRSVARRQYNSAYDFVICGNVFSEKTSV